MVAAGDNSQLLPWEEYEAADAGAEASRIGGRAGDEYLDPAQRPLVEAGEGVAEGFELAEEDLISASETGEGGTDPEWQVFIQARVRNELREVRRGGPRRLIGASALRQVKRRNP